MSPAISSAKKAEMARRKKYKASTRGAMVEADAGKRGGMLRVSFSAHHDDDERAERQDGGGARQAERAHDHQAVTARHRVVGIAIQEERVRGGAAHAVGS